MLFLVNGRNVDGLVFREHVVFQGPAGAASELGDNDVAVAEELNVKVDVVDWLLTC
jgi:hypothetical protein